MSKFIGIKRLWYTDVIENEVKQSDIASLLALPATKEVKNVHQDTWGYNEDDPSTTDYKNELTGLNYFRDITEKGNKTIAFTMGEYDYETKAALQGGTVVYENGIAVGWKSNGSLTLVHKAIIALTKTDTYIIFTNANIVAKGDQQQKAIGLGISAVAEENPAFEELPTAAVSPQSGTITGTVYEGVSASETGAVKCALSDGNVVYLSGTAASGTASSEKTYYTKDTANKTKVFVEDEYWYDASAA